MIQDPEDGDGKHFSEDGSRVEGVEIDYVRAVLARRIRGAA